MASQKVSHCLLSSPANVLTFLTLLTPQRQEPLSHPLRVRCCKISCCFSPLPSETGSYYAVLAGLKPAALLPVSRVLELLASTTIPGSQFYFQRVPIYIVTATVQSYTISRLENWNGTC